MSRQFTCFSLQKMEEIVFDEHVFVQNGKGGSGGLVNSGRTKVSGSLVAVKELLFRKDRLRLSSQPSFKGCQVLRIGDALSAGAKIAPGNVCQVQVDGKMHLAVLKEHEEELSPLNLQHHIDLFGFCSEEGEQRSELKPPTQWTRFNAKRRLVFQEIEILMGLPHHPNILPIQGFGELIEEEVDRIFIVTPYFKKGDLLSCLLSVKIWNEKMAVAILIPLLRGIIELHSAGICHRDLKLENILVRDDGQPVIADFGHATMSRGEDGREHQLWDVVGTHSIRAPEIWKLTSKVKGSGYFGEAADMWSMGVVIHNVVTRGMPQIFSAGSWANMERAEESDAGFLKLKVARLQSRQPRLRPEISQKMESIILRLLNLSPEERPRPKQILDDLERSTGKRKRDK